MSRWRCGLLIACVIVTGWLDCARRMQQGDRRPAAFGSQIDALFAFWGKPGSPGAAVAVIHEGKVIYTRGYGAANLETGEPIGPQTVFNAGSVAKQFTAFVVLSLAERGRLSLDDPLRRHLDDFPAYGAGITLRQMLHHTSGLRDFWTLTDLAGWPPDELRTTVRVHDLLARQRGLNFIPGQEFGYSNTNYLLLAEIVERVTGRPFSDVAAETIFAPLGMAHTSFNSGQTELPPTVPYAWRGRDVGYREDPVASTIAGPGNLYTTVGDLVLWADHLMTGRLIGGLRIAAMREAGRVGDRETGYGAGLFISRRDGLTTLSHGGATGGFRAHLAVYPERRFAVAVLANASNVRADILAQKIAGRMLLGQEPVEAESAAKAGAGLEPLSAYTGRFELEGGAFLDVKPLGKGLFIQFSGGAPRRLIPRTPRQFASEEVGVGVEFSALHGGRFTRVVVRAGARRMSGRRLQAPRLSRRTLNTYAGSYRSEELAVTYRLEVDDASLTIDRKQVKSLTLVPIGRDRFCNAESCDLVLAFRRNRTGRVTGFELSAPRARGLLFRKR